MVAYYWDLIRHIIKIRYRTMNDTYFLIIDGAKVSAKQPFILQYYPPEEDPLDYQRTPKIQNSLFSPFIFSKVADDIQPIDHMMLRYGSVSSLRDFHLFGPPAFNPTHPPDGGCCHGPKKTLYLNQFTEFRYGQFPYE